jgi:hypothetical protein
MPLTLKQQMAKTLAQMIVEQPDKFGQKTIDAARSFMGMIDKWGDRIAYGRYSWERDSTSWEAFRPLLEEALPALMEADTEK